MNTVKAIAQDSSGIMWFGTQSGLNSYDGYQIKTYFHDPQNSSSLINNDIRSLFTDSKGRLWIGTESGVVYLDRDSRDFKQVKLVSKTQPAPVVFSVIEDESNNILFGTSIGLYSIDSAGSVTAVPLVPSPDHVAAASAFTSIRSLFIDTQETVWAGSESDGVFSGTLADGFKPLVLSKPVPMLNVRAIAEDVAGGIWIGTFNHGAFLVDPIELSVVKKPELKSSRVRALALDSAGDLLIGSDQGLVRLRKDGSFTTHLHDPLDPYSMGNSIVLAIFAGQSGDYWLGTFGGVSLWNDERSAAYLFRPSLQFREQGADDQAVTSFAESNGGDLWVGSYSGLIRLAKDEGEFELLRPEKLGLSDFRVMSLGFVDDELWVGSMASGVDVVDENETVVRSYAHDPFDRNSLSGNGVTDIFSDTQGRVWLSTYGQGLNLYLGNNKFQRLPRPENQSSFSDLHCMVVAEDSLGFLWIATDGGGLIKFNPESEETKIYRHSAMDEASIGSDHLISLRVTEAGVWAGSVNSGASFFNFQTGKFSRYLDSVGPIYGILEDDQNGVWLSGTDSVYVMRAGSESPERFAKSFGLQLGDFSGNSALKYSSGILFFGGTEGFNFFDPRGMKKTARHSPLLITDYRLDNVSSLYVDAPQTELTLELDHRHSSVMFSVSLLDYYWPARNRYRFKMQGFESNWSETSDDRSVSYTNLPSGSYELLVEASNNDNRWNADQLRIPIHVQPPPWATWWAYTAYALLALFLFYQSLAFNTKRVKREASDSFNKKMQNYVFSLDETSECVLNANPKGNILFMNTAASEILGLSPSQLLGHPIFNTLFQQAAEREQAKKILVAKGKYQSEVDYVTTDGESKVLEIGLTKTEPADINEVAYVSVVRDVTEKSSERERSEKLVAQLSHKTDILSQQLGESVAEKYRQERGYIKQLNLKNEQLYQVHDRVHDNFQMLASLLSIQIGNTLDAQQQSLIEEVQQRIFAVALVHENMLRGGELERVDMAKYLDALVVGLYRSHAPTMVTVELRKEIEEFELPMEQAVPCGLIVNELVTNALDHAWADKQFGSGLLSFHCICSGADCVVTIADDGHGLPVGFKVESGESMGMEIASILIKQLGGTLRLIGGPGTTLELRFPL